MFEKTFWTCTLGRIFIRFNFVSEKAIANEVNQSRFHMQLLTNLTVTLVTWDKAYIKPYYFLETNFCEDIFLEVRF